MMRFNAGQRKVAKIVLISTAALLLLGLMIDAVEDSTHGGVGGYDRSKAMDKLVKKYGPPRDFYFGEFLVCLIRAPRLYAAGLLLGLAVFIHKDTTKD